MRIQIKGSDRDMNLRLPTTLIFSRVTVWLANHVGRRYAGDAMKDIPPEALDALFAEIRRIKKEHNSWELVHVESSDGEQVSVIL